MVLLLDLDRVVIGLLNGRRGRRLSGRFELCHARSDDLCLPFVLQETQDLLADSVVIEIRPHVLNNIVDDGPIDGRLRNMG